MKPEENNEKAIELERLRDELEERLVKLCREATRTEYIVAVYWVNYEPSEADGYRRGDHEAYFFRMNQDHSEELVVGTHKILYRNGFVYFEVPKTTGHITVLLPEPPLSLTFSYRSDLLDDVSQDWIMFCEFRICETEEEADEWSKRELKRH